MSNIPNVFSYLSLKNVLKLFVIVNSVSKATSSRMSSPDAFDASRQVVPRYGADPSAWSAIAAATKPGVGAQDGSRQRAARSLSRAQNRRSVRSSVDAGTRRLAERAKSEPTAGVPGTLPPESINGPAGAWEIPGLGARKKALLQACATRGITDPARQAQILAAALIEGDLSCNTDPNKQGLSATRGVFNLNMGLIHDLGLGHLEAALHNVEDLPTSLAASVQVIDAAIQTYGLEGFKLWQRGGQTLKNDPAATAQRFGWLSYSAAFDNTVAYILSGSGLTDDYRYAERVPAV